jgi:hypothetical protein
VEAPVTRPSLLAARERDREQFIGTIGPTQQPPGVARESREPNGTLCPLHRHRRSTPEPVAAQQCDRILGLGEWQHEATSIDIDLDRRRPVSIPLGLSRRQSAQWDRVLGAAPVAYGGLAPEEPAMVSGVKVVQPCAEVVGRRPCRAPGPHPDLE